jgi:lipid-A-disaccharide synthase
MPRHVFLSAGELSGDMVGARLVAELRQRDPSLIVSGTGGRRLAEAGVTIDNDTSRIGVVGVTEALATVPAVVRAYRAIRRRVATDRPDVAVLIGNDVFNVFLARALRRQGIPTVAYFPPQVWVWRSLAGFIARSFDAIVTSFPEEHDVYRRADATAAVRFVGHYLVDEIHPVTDEERAKAQARLGLRGTGPIVGVLPGSRGNEVRALLPVMRDAVARLAARSPHVQFAFAAAETVDEAALGGLHDVRPPDRVCVSRDSRLVMQSADLLLMASGTATLEAALLGVPMVIAYKVSTVTHWCVLAAVRLGLIESYRVGLPNLVLNEAAIPEALQGRATGTVVAEEAWRLLTDEPRLAAMRGALASVSARLRGPHALGATADAILAWSEERRVRRATTTQPQPAAAVVRAPEPD